MMDRRILQAHNRENVAPSPQTRAITPKSAVGPSIPVQATPKSRKGLPPSTSARKKEQEECLRSQLSRAKDLGLRNAELEKMARISDARATELSQQVDRLTVKLREREVENADLKELLREKGGKEAAMQQKLGEYVMTISALEAKVQTLLANSVVQTRGSALAMEVCISSPLVEPASQCPPSSARRRSARLSQPTATPSRVLPLVPSFNADPLPSTVDREPIDSPSMPANNWAEDSIIEEVAMPTDYEDFNEICVGAGALSSILPLSLTSDSVAWTPLKGKALWSPPAVDLGNQLVSSGIPESLVENSCLDRTVAVDGQEGIAGISPTLTVDAHPKWDICDSPVGEEVETAPDTTDAGSTAVKLEAPIWDICGDPDPTSILPITVPETAHDKADIDRRRKSLRLATRRSIGAPGELPFPIESSVVSEDSAVTSMSADVPVVRDDLCIGGARRVRASTAGIGSKVSTRRRSVVAMQAPVLKSIPSTSSLASVSECSEVKSSMDITTKDVGAPTQRPRSSRRRSLLVQPAAGRHAVTSTNTSTSAISEAAKPTRSTKTAPPPVAPQVVADASHAVAEPPRVIRSKVGAAKQVTATTSTSSRTTPRVNARDRAGARASAAASQAATCGTGTKQPAKSKRKLAVADGFILSTVTTAAVPLPQPPSGTRDKTPAKPTALARVLSPLTTATLTAGEVHSLMKSWFPIDCTGCTGPVVLAMAQVLAQKEFGGSVFNAAEEGVPRRLLPILQHIVAAEAIAVGVPDGSGGAGVVSFQGHDLSCLDTPVDSRPDSICNVETVISLLEKLKGEGAALFERVRGGASIVGMRDFIRALDTIAAVSSRRKGDLDATQHTHLTSIIRSAAGIPAERFARAALFFRDELRGLVCAGAGDHPPCSGPNSALRQRYVSLLSSAVRFHLRRLFNSPPPALTAATAMENGGFGGAGRSTLPGVRSCVWQKVKMQCPKSWAASDGAIASVLSQVLLVLGENGGTVATAATAARESLREVESLAAKGLPTTGAGRSNLGVIRQGFLVAAEVCATGAARSFLLQLLSWPGVQDAVDDAGGWKPVENLAAQLVTASCSGDEDLYLGLLENVVSLKDQLAAAELWDFVPRASTVLDTLERTMMECVSKRAEGGSRAERELVNEVRRDIAFPKLVAVTTPSVSGQA